MKIAKKALACFLVIAMFLTAAPLSGFVGLLPFLDEWVVSAQSANVVDGGTTADGMTWTVYDDGELVISGEGEMQDYFEKIPEGEPSDALTELTEAEKEEVENSADLNDYYLNITPWADYRHEITSVTVENGITEIGRQAFGLLYKAETVSLPESLVCIGAGAFSGMLSLEEISIPVNVKEINSGAFSHCVCLKKLNIPEGLEIIGDSVFSLCLSLKEIVLPENAEGIISVDFFAGCYDLEKLIIPNGITFKTSTAFESDISEAEKLQYMEEELNYAQRVKRELEEARKKSVLGNPRVKLPPVVDESVPAPQKKKKRNKRELTPEEIEQKLRAKETPEETKARHRASLLDDLPDLPDLPEEREQKRRAKETPEQAKARRRAELLDDLPDVDDMRREKESNIPEAQQDIPKIDDDAEDMRLSDALGEDPFADIHWNNEQTTFTIRF